MPSTGVVLSDDKQWIPRAAMLDTQGNLVPTEVLFRFKSSSSTAEGDALAYATVLQQGDLDINGSVDIFDNVILGNYIVGNVTPGVAPFKGNAAQCDANSDWLVDVFDVVLHQSFIVGNVACLTPPLPGQIGPNAPVGGIQATGTASIRTAKATTQLSETWIPVEIDLTSATVQGSPAQLGGYLLRADFDRALVAFVGARPGLDSSFVDDPVFTDPDRANAEGSVLIISANSRSRASGVVNVGRVGFRELSPGGLASVRVSIIDTCTPPMPVAGADPKPIRIPTKTK